MARHLEVDQTVYVPSEKLGLTNQPAALYRTTVVEVVARSVRVRLPNGDPSERIGSSLCHERAGVLVLLVGDFSTERTLLEPLSKCVFRSIVIADSGRS